MTLAETTHHSIEEQVRRMTPIGVPLDQRENVVAISRMLDRVAPTRDQRDACKLVGPNGEGLSIPESMFYVLERVAEVLARGDSVTVVAVGKELTTQQAADMLNVSRQYVVRLLNEGRIPYVKTGKHRRIRVEDVLAFKEQRDSERMRSLDELAQMTEELGGYDELG